MMIRGLNSFGFTLTEILVTLGLLSILGTVATVSYQGYKIDAEKTNLKNSGVLYPTALQNCIATAGGWEIDHPAYTPPKMYPCKLEHTTGTQGGSVPKETTYNNLKNILDYTCPVDISKPDSACRVFTHGDPRPTHNYTCLSIEKKVSGKNLQIIVVIPFNNPSDYNIWCGEVSSFVPVTGRICKRGGSGMGRRPCEAGEQPKQDNCSGETNAQITKDLKKCDWK